MGTLYISGAQCVHAEFKDGDHWENFDEQEKALQALAETFEVSVDRRRLDDQGDHCFVIMHKRHSFGAFYSGAAFEADMAIETSEEFPNRARAFIKALQEDESLSDFHNLEWLGPRTLYFVSS